MGLGRQCTLVTGLELILMYITEEENKDICWDVGIGSCQCAGCRGSIAIADTGR